MFKARSRLWKNARTACLFSLRRRVPRNLKIGLIGRGSESPDEIERRVAAAESELKLKDKYDHVVINKVLADTVAEINDIIMRET